MREIFFLIYSLLLTFNSYCQLSFGEYIKSHDKNMDSGNFYGAIDDLTNALEFEQNIIDASHIYYMRGNAKMNLEHWNSAIFDFNKSLENKPELQWASNFNNLNIYFKRAFAKMKLKNYYGAISDFNNALLNVPDNYKMLPNYSGAYAHRSFAKMKLGDLNNALIDINKSIELNSKNGKFYFFRMLIKIQLNSSNKENLQNGNWNFCEDAQLAQNFGFSTVELPAFLNYCNNL